VKFACLRFSTVLLVGTQNGEAQDFMCQPVIFAQTWALTHPLLNSRFFMGFPWVLTSHPI
jgi:hypothetical protein